MVDITASIEGFDNQAHVFCGDCFWGEDVPADKAVQIATEHEATAEHIEAELAAELVELLAEAQRIDRGH